MADVGANPARNIPAWRDFLATYADGDRPLRGIGEPIYAGRGPDELVECQRHEDLLNVAFAGTPAWWLVCPYDVTALPADVLAEARRSHPLVDHDDSPDYRGLAREAVPFDAPLPRPSGESVEMTFGPADLHELRAFVARHAACFGFDESRSATLVLAVNEVATNSVRHGGGTGVLRIWPDGDTLLCEIRDHGHLANPLAGRVRPGPDSIGGWGLWLANQMCDLVQLRSFGDGTVVRLHMRH
jgi:anti-sigma regulatory factor (Ser/Thr protein kinase)